MSVENASAFFKKLEEDEAFRTRILKDERLKNATPETILGVAEAEGFPFTLDELKQAQEALKDVELSDEELEQVVGAGGACYIFGVGVGIWYDSEANSSGAACLGLGFTFGPSTDDGGP